MKSAGRKLALVLVLAVTTGHLAHAQDDFADGGLRVNLGLGGIGFGGIFPFDGNPARGEFVFSALEIGAEHSASRVGFTFSPFTYFIRDSGTASYGLQSLLNLHVYWNAVSHQGIFFGPFASGHYLFFANGLDPEKFTFTAGLRGGFRMEVGAINMNFISVETGFRTVDGSANWFVGGKIDLFPILLSGFNRPWFWVFRW